MPLPMPPEAPPAPDRERHQRLRTSVGELWITRTDQALRPYLQKRGAWEEDEGALLSTLLRPGCRFLDVGANIGYFSLFAFRSAPGVIIDAVEPHPNTVRLLRWNAWVNRVPMTVWPYALDARVGEVWMSAPEVNVGDCRVGPSDRPGSFTVTAVTGDALFAGRGFDVVKIDVQGWEREVLRGMRGVLAASPGVALVVEFWPHSLRERGVEPYSVLEEYRGMGFDMVTQVGDRLCRLDDDAIVLVCDNAGLYGQVNLLLR
jgi:FkbM family methyltransferase